MSKEKKTAKESSLFKSMFRPWKLVLTGFLGIVLVFLLTAAGLFGPLPDFKEIENPDIALASEVLAADGETLGKIFLVNRVSATFDELPDHLVHALVATEDARFERHAGVDLKSTLRAFAFLGKRGGGSTLTQQLAKNQLHRPGRNILQRGIQKLKEYVVSVKLERSYTKQEIIAMYLNQVDFVNNAVGIKTAARVYFNKEISELSPEESATLVGMVKNPSYYNPASSRAGKLELVENRRNVVLLQRSKFNTKYFGKRIDVGYKDSLQKVPLKLDYKADDHNAGLAPYMRSVIQNDFLKKWITDNPKNDKGDKWDMYRDGLKIYTTIDAKMQVLAEKAVTEHLIELQTAFDKQNKARDPWKDKKANAALQQAISNSERYNSLKRNNKAWSRNRVIEEMKKPEQMAVYHPVKGQIDTLLSPLDSIKHHRLMLQSAFITMEPSSGYIKTWVGGRNFKYFKLDHVVNNTDNPVKRQVGSTFKPFLYTVALDNGWSPCFTVPNLPVSVQNPNGRVWTPKNSGGGDYDGRPITLKSGLASSMNNISAYLIKEIGPRPVITLAERMGLENVPEVNSIALGTTEQSVLAMTHAYSAFANNGVSVQPIFISRIEDKNGNVLAEFVPDKKEAISKELAWTMLQMMRGVVTSGTSTRLSYRYGLDNFIAGKTGTTDDHSDGWFVGLTPDLIGTVWTGCDDPVLRFRGIGLGQGANMALPIWGKFFKSVYEDESLGITKYAHFRQPAFTTISMDCTTALTPDDGILVDDGSSSSVIVNPGSGTTVEETDEVEEFD